jgi:glycosyltransferase involved in cell wall biosynthesis
MLPVLYIVSPCYNEEEVLHEVSKRLDSLFADMIDKKLIDDKSKIVFVNDGSKDKTWEEISKISEQNSRFIGVKLSRNCGHQNALLAGLLYAKEFADCAISIDADLQDDINVIPEFIAKFNEGCDVVYGVRKSRKTDTFFKKSTAQFFYKLMNKLGVKVVYNHADYRLLSKRALEDLAEYKEVNLFLRGVVPLIGYRSDYVYYDRFERFAGESKYPLKKMLTFAWDGITSFSVTPIRFVWLVGMVIFALSIFATLYALVKWLLGETVSGWTSISISIWALGGIQLFSLGMIGEYIGKIYKETKARPKYHIETITRGEKDEK